MSTQALYYEDSHMTQFTARVVGCTTILMEACPYVHTSPLL